jgi:hypothetical protein
MWSASIWLTRDLHEASGDHLVSSIIPFVTKRGLLWIRTARSPPCDVIPVVCVSHIRLGVLDHTRLSNSLIQFRCFIKNDSFIITSWDEWSFLCSAYLLIHGSGCCIPTCVFSFRTLSMWSDVMGFSIYFGSHNPTQDKNYVNGISSLWTRNHLNSTTLLNPARIPPGNSECICFIIIEEIKQKQTETSGTSSLIVSRVCAHTTRLVIRVKSKMGSFLCEDMCQDATRKGVFYILYQHFGVVFSF